MSNVSSKPKSKALSLLPIVSPTADLPKGHEIILVVEDEAIVRSYIASVLKALGYDVFEAPDGEEALRLCHGILAGRIDLLLADVVMPKMSGKQLAYLMGQFFPETKILLCSGYPEKLAASNGMIDPTLPFLQKPITPKELAFKVREVLDTARLNFEQQPNREEVQWFSSDAPNSEMSDSIPPSSN